MVETPKNSPPHDEAREELKAAALLATGLVAAAGWDVHQANTNAQQEVKEQALAHEIVAQSTADYQREYENLTQKRAHEIIEANIGMGLLAGKFPINTVYSKRTHDGTLPRSAEQAKQSWAGQAKLSQNANSKSERH